MVSSMKSSLPRLRFLLHLGIFLAFAACMARPAAAADEGNKTPKPNADAAKETPKPAPPAPEEPKLSVTQHSVVINGKTISYKATVGYLLLKQEVEDNHP